MITTRLVSQLFIVLFFSVPISIAAPADPSLSPFSHTLGHSPEWSESARLAEHSLLLDIARMGETFIAVGERGHVLVSKDHGIRWTQISVPSRSMLTAVMVADQGHCWIVGHDAVILHSSDGGKTWARQFYAPDLRAPLLDVWFENSSHGLAVGAYNLVLETHDGGKNWKRRPIGESDAHLYAITSGPDGTLYVAGEFGTVFRSNNQGKSWTRLSTPYNGTFFGMVAPASGSLFLFGLRGNLYVSHDSGLTWNKIDMGGASSLMSGGELIDGTIVFVGLGGTILVSQDSRNFMSTRIPTLQSFSSIVEIEPRTILAVGEAGFTRIPTVSIYQSEDKGGS